ncbi:hypothetical protein AGMMS49992_19380 [Clostridia bacterium]|nr:hypothetical protein AGMMS49992_19380 [Clostridia bacterium]
MTALDGLKLRLQIFDDAFDDALNSSLDSAADFICMYTGRDSVPEALSVELVRVAAIMFRRRNSHGSIPRGSLANILPDDLHKVLNQWRVPVAGRLRRRG